MKSVEANTKSKNKLKGGGDQQNVRIEFILIASPKFYLLESNSKQKSNVQIINPRNDEQ